MERKQDVCRSAANALKVNCRIEMAIDPNDPSNAYAKVIAIWNIWIGEDDMDNGTLSWFVYVTDNFIVWLLLN